MSDVRVVLEMMAKAKEMIAEGRRVGMCLSLDQNHRFIFWESVYTGDGEGVPSPYDYKVYVHRSLKLANQHRGSDTFVTFRTIHLMHDVPTFHREFTIEHMPDEFHAMLKEANAPD